MESPTTEAERHKLEKMPEKMPDVEHISQRAGTLLLGASYDKSVLETHGIERLDTNFAANLKTTKDGEMILIPQPPDDPEHPLNWSWRRKHIVLAVLTYTTLMTDMTSAWDIPLVVPQAAYWKISTTNAGRNLSGNIFLLGVGGLVVVPMSRWLGRLPVLFWAMTLAFFMTIFAALAPTWISFIVARCLQGFFVTAPQAVGLSVIHDMFFFHEHARKIGIWAATFIFSPYLGPFLSGIVSNFRSWRISMWLNVGLLGLAMLAVIIFGEETLPPANSQLAGSQKSSGIMTRLLNRAKALVGVTGYQAKHKGVGRTVHDMLVVISRPHFLALCFFYLLTFMWSIGLNTTLILFVEPPPPVGYGFSTLTVSLFYIAPMLASVIGELFGHWFNDFIVYRQLRKAKGVFEPEVRLWTIWISIAFLIGGLVFFGYGLERNLPWIALVMAWAMYGFGIVTLTVAVTAYSLDVFPDHGVEAASIINFFRTSGGFIVNYFQVSWADHSGPTVTFGAEAGIVAASFVLVLLVQVLGEGWRMKYHSPTAVE